MNIHYREEEKERLQRLQNIIDAVCSDEIVNREVEEECSLSSDFAKAVNDPDCDMTDLKERWLRRDRFEYSEYTKSMLRLIEKVERAMDDITEIAKERMVILRKKQ